MRGRSIAACALALAFLALSGKAVLAQGQGQDRVRDTAPESANGATDQGGYTLNDQDRQAIQDDQDGRRAPGGHGDRWGGERHYSFNAHDRRITREWYAQNRHTAGRGWGRRDRLSHEMQDRLRRGHRLDADLRQHMYWLPAELSRRYGPAPRGYSYGIIGGNVVMLDDEFRVHDVFSINPQ